MHIKSLAGVLALGGSMVALLVACGDDDGATTTTATTASSMNTGGSTANSGGGGMNTGGDGGGGNAEGGGGGEPTLNGCTLAEAMDATGMDPVDLSALDPWVIGHQLCVRVDVGATITMDGDFTAHPLAQGESPTSEAGPITTAGEAVNGGGQGQASFTLDTAGDYPYFCTIHVATMKGVIYAE